MKNILWIVLLLALAAGGYAWWMFNKPHEDVRKMSADLSMTSSELLSMFEKDGRQAGDALADNILLISGRPSAIEKSGDQVMIRFDEQGDYVIQSYLSPESEALAADSGDRAITLKCKYAGLVINDEDFLIPADIKIEQCFIVN